VTVRVSTFTSTILFVLVVAGLAAAPTPFWLMAPGKAVDLSTRISVEGHAPPQDRYYLTDVTLTRASVLLLAAKALPGVRVIREDAVVPPGASQRGYDRVLADAMNQSQDVAAVVAERAAGLRVADPARQVVVVDILPASRAIGLLSIGDRVLAVQGRTVASARDAGRLIAHLPAGGAALLRVDRNGRSLTLLVPRGPAVAGGRIGVLLETRFLRPDLPVPVRFALDNIAGSSGGLMFALQIYATLHRMPRAAGAVAGTGTLAFDGTVGAIEGTEQKLIAAKRAGARVFLVPRANFSDIAAERGIRIVPVDSFREALAALRS
jgi:PDZ domain-containing protein